MLKSLFLPTEAAADVTKRPQIYYCRSPNMEDFTCWWHPLDNLTAGEEVAYVLTYSKEYVPILLSMRGSRGAAGAPETSLRFLGHVSAVTLISFDFCRRRAFKTSICESRGSEIPSAVTRGPPDARQASRVASNSPQKCCQ